MTLLLKASVTVLVILVLLTLGLFASLPDPADSSRPGRFSHRQLEADRVMTQRMTVDAQMAGSNDMLQRSANPDYVRALEQHAAEIDRMLGRAP